MLFAAIAIVVIAGPASALLPLIGKNPMPQPYTPPPTCTTAAGSDVVVTDCGDVSGADDSPMIQRANDFVAARGGGRVIFPAGTYQAKDITQDSHVEFFAPAGPAATTIQRVATDNGWTLISSRLRQTYGRITQGTSTLTVSSATGILPGAVVGIRGAGEPPVSQRTQLLAAMGPSQTTFTMKSLKGFPVSGPNFLLIDDEVVSYKNLTIGPYGIATATGVTRGVFATKAVAHGASAPVSQSQRLYAKVVSVTEQTVTIDRTAPRSVNYAPVTIGAVAPAVTGLTLTGYQSPDSNHSVLFYALTGGARVTDSVIEKGNGTGLLLTRGSRDAVIENNSFRDNGSQNLSAAIWFFSAVRNTVRGNTFDEDWAGMVVDDRSSASSEWDGGSNDNLIEDNRFKVLRRGKWDETNAAVVVEASSDNVVKGNTVTGPAPGDLTIPGPRNGIYVTKNAVQGLIPGQATSNQITGNTVVGNLNGILINATANDIIGNRVDAAEWQPIDDREAGNYYEANTCTDASGAIVDCSSAGSSGY